MSHSSTRLSPDADPRTSGRTTDRPRVAIIGGGTAGAHAAAALRDRPVAVTIIEPTGNHQFLTRLAGVAGGTQPPIDATAPLSELFPSATIERGRVVAIDETPDQVAIRLADDRIVTVDAAVITAGAESATPPIPGLDRARTLRSASDAAAIRALLPAVERLVVVGGGATGCQLAGTATAAHPDLSVTLVEASEALLPGFHPALGRRTGEILRGRRVEVECDVAVERVRTRGVTLADSGRRVDGLVVWTGGVTADGARFGVGETRDGRLVIDGNGRVVGSSRVFAAGDVAAHTDRNGALLPMSAQIAAQAGRSAGTNTAQFLLGGEPREMHLRDLGWVVDLGGGRGVAEIFGLPMADPITDRLVPLLHTAIDYRNLWQIGGIHAMRHHGPHHSTAPDIHQLDRELAEFGLEL